MNKRFALLAMSVLIVSVFFLSGCGSKSSGPTVKWAGTVTLDGQPIPSDAIGTIIVQTSGQAGQAGSTQGSIVNGQYSLKDVPQGSVLVRFNILQQKPSTRPEDAGRGIIDSTDLTPKKWQKGVEDTATANDTNKNFDLTKK